MLLAKIDRLPGRMHFAILRGQKFTCGEAGGQTVGTNLILGVDLNILGYNGSNELCERSMAQKLRPQQANKIFHQKDKKIVKSDFLLCRTRKFCLFFLF